MSIAPTALRVRAEQASSGALELELRGADLHVTIATRHYRVRGLAQNHNPQQLRVSLLAQRAESRAQLARRVCTRLDDGSEGSRDLFPALLREMGGDAGLHLDDRDAVVSESCSSRAIRNRSSTARRRASSSRLRTASSARASISRTRDCQRLRATAVAAAETSQPVA